MSSLPILRVKTADLPVMEARDWADKVRASLKGDLRLVTLFGRKADAASALLTAVLQDEGGALQAVRGTASLEHGYHTLSRDFPAAQCFERELRAVGPEDHRPSLAALRFGRHPRMMKGTASTSSSKDVHEAVGPIHAGVIEPGSFRFMCLGETVHHLEIQPTSTAPWNLSRCAGTRGGCRIAERSSDTTIARLGLLRGGQAVAGMPMSEDVEASAPSALTRASPCTSPAWRACV